MILLPVGAGSISSGSPVPQPVHRETRNFKECFLMPDTTELSPLDRWMAACSILRAMSDAELAQYRSDTYTCDIRRLSLLIQGEKIGVNTTLDQIDQKIVARLQEHWRGAYQDDNRMLHYLRCQLQSLMTQGIFALNRQFVEEYRKSYVSKGQILAEVPADFGDALQLYFSDARVIIIAISRQKVCTLPGLQDKGYDAQRTTIEIDLSAITPGEMLLGQGACQITVEFHGFTPNFSDIKFGSQP